MYLLATVGTMVVDFPLRHTQKQQVKYKKRKTFICVLLFTIPAVRSCFTGTLSDEITSSFGSSISTSFRSALGWKWGRGRGMRREWPTSMESKESLDWFAFSILVKGFAREKSELVKRAYFRVKMKIGIGRFRKFDREIDK